MKIVEQSKMKSAFLNATIKDGTFIILSTNQFMQLRCVVKNSVSLLNTWQKIACNSVAPK